MAERHEFEVAFVDLDGIGSGAAYWAAKRAGAGVLGLERFEIGHEAARRRITRGSSG